MTARAARSAPVIHVDPRRMLTLSEVAARPTARPSTADRHPEPTEPADITSPDGTTSPPAGAAVHIGAVARQAVVEAVALHLSPRAANPDLRPSLRMAYVAAALDHAARCPLCAYGGDA